MGIDVMEKTIHTIAAATWTRFNKWRVELEIAGESKRVCWLSAAQYDFLSSAFEHTKNGYSDKHVAVIGEFSDDEKGYYIRCKAVAVPPARKHFTPLVQEEEIDNTLLDQD
jgi:hypothetical protein